MKKGIIILALFVGSALLLTAYERTGNFGYGRSENLSEVSQNSNDERLRRNAVSAEDCTLEGDEVGTGYLDNETRQYQNQNNSGRGRNRRS